MRRRAATVDWSEPVLRLYLVGDTHVGAEACDEKRIERLAEIIADDPAGRVVGLGDYIEAIAPTDRRFDARELAQPIAPEHLTNPFYCQALRFCRLFEPTAGRWACVISGNHETTALSRYHFDATAVVAERMGTAYHGGADEGGWLQVRMKENGKLRNTVSVYIQHGWGGGEMRSADAGKLQRLLWRKAADVVAIAHVHRPMVFPETVEYIDRAGWEQVQTRWGVVAYPMVSKHGYIARRGGNAPAAGYAVVTIERQHDGAALIGAELRAL
ncbi:MAG: hypothetical protein GX601_19110 [Anaerolineales bacterium]|nr:hypothetical protein [Anaerolineales bacterium]